MASYTFKAARVFDFGGSRVGADLVGSGPSVFSGVGLDSRPETSAFASSDTSAFAGAFTGAAETADMPGLAPVAGHIASCFAAGTEISVVDGIRLVEDIVPGDRVRTFDARDVVVKWIGRQTVSAKFGLDDHDVPVRISAGALGPKIPTRDLVVAAGHAILIGDTLCHAAALVNGSTVTRLDRNAMSETFTVYHLETEEHEVIVANGAAADTFIDKAARAELDNFEEFRALFGDVAQMEELGYPRALTPRQVPVAIRAALASDKRN